jgi:hypothetical protein
MKKNRKTGIPFGLYSLAESNRPLTISEKLLDKPLLGDASPVSTS